MERVEDEISNIFGDDRERPATMEDLSSLKYLECFIKETMRLYPSVTFISRECNEDVMIEVQLALHMELLHPKYCHPSHTIPESRNSCKDRNSVIYPRPAP